MTGHEPTENQSMARGLLRGIVDHNPFFLVSGVLMLAGCFMINGSAHDDPNVVWPVVGLVTVFNIYEFMIIGLAVYLARTRRFYRDAGFLLLLEVLLLCDVSLAYNELLLKSLPIGMVVSAMAVALVGMKLLIIDRGLGLRCTKAGAWMVILLIVLLFVLPGVFRELIDKDLIHEWHYYAAWWVLAALPPAVSLTQPWFRGRRRLGRSGMDRLRNWIVGLLIVIPYVSLLLHLRAAYYVDDRPFYLYNLAPVVLGLTAMWIYTRSHKMPVQHAVSTACFAGAAAVLLSLSYPGAVVAPMIPPDSLIFSPLRLVLVMTALLMTYAWWWRGAWMCLPPAVGLLVAAGMGHSVYSITGTIRDMLQRSRSTGSDLTPDTMFGWGVLAVIGSFAFLVIGAAISLAKRVPRGENEPR
jgi:hypothetical protein